MFRIPASLPVAMESTKDLVIEAPDNPEANCQTTITAQQIGSESNDSSGTISTTVSNSRLDPKTGDHHMESRIPEESASTLPFGETIHPNTLTIPVDGRTTTPNQQPPSKRPRIPSSAAAGGTSREYLNLSAQHLIDEINEKRKADTLLLGDFKKAMEMQVATSYGILEQSMYQMYERNGKIMQSKLQELFATLDRISKLESELQQFKGALGALYTDIQGPS